jgi:NADH-quinone oxidoreductase subunit G
MVTVSITIDGRTLVVEKGRTVLQAALDNGIPIPHFCYHPALGIDGSCRVCLVQIERLPKLQTACSVVCTDGMVVRTNTPEVIEARAGVFEFLLLHHPLDCPVCDKGGECPLQDFSSAFGASRSRTEFPRRVFDGEGAAADVDFGPTLVLNRNRCILCTRCVRFMRDIDGGAQIGIVNRGADSEIATFREQGVHSLLSGNLMDVCPVGAITTRDYRFKSRPWDNPQAVDTICTYCAKGCNTTVWIKAKPEWAKGPRVVRITPRLNAEVNGYWMCDAGRFDYHWVESSQRLQQPLARDEDGAQRPVAWHDLPARLHERVAIDGTAQGLRFLLSAHASLEEMYLVGRLATGIAPESGSGAVALSWRWVDKIQPARTTFKVPADDAPNVRGARDLGLVARADRESTPGLLALRAAVEAGAVQALYVLDPGPAGSIGDVSWVIGARRGGTLPLLIVQGVVTTDLSRAADFVLPGACSFEKRASYANDLGRVQVTTRVSAPPGEAMDDWQILLNVGAVLGAALAYTDADQVRADIARALAADAAYADLPRIASARPAGLGTWLQTSNPSERWKWDRFFRDLPPTKFGDDPINADR